MKLCAPPCLIKVKFYIMNYYVDSIRSNDHRNSGLSNHRKTETELVITETDLFNQN